MKTLKSGARLKTRRIQIAHDPEKEETIIRKAAALERRSKRLGRCPGPGSRRGRSELRLAD